MVKEIVIPYTNPKEMINGLNRQYNMNFRKEWGVYNCTIPSSLGSGWMSVYSKEDIHFIRTNMHFHEPVEFSSSDPVENLIDIRIRKGERHKSSFLHRQQKYEWNMHHVNAISIFIPTHYFETIDKDAITLKLNQLQYIHSLKSDIDQLLDYQYTSVQSNLKLESQLLKYCHSIFEYLNEPRTPIHHNNKFEQIIEAQKIIEKQFVTPPSIKSLARAVGLNETDLQKLFKANYGKTIRQYCIDLRISHAAELVIKTNKPIIKIMRQVGYQNRYHFNRLYHKQTGFLPLEHREETC